jgi:hypothetical protein
MPTPVPNEVELQLPNKSDVATPSHKTSRREHIDMGWKFYAVLLGVIPVSGVLLIVILIPLLPEGLTSPRGIWVAFLPLAFLPMKFLGAYLYCKHRVTSVRRRILYSLVSCVLSLVIVGGYLGLVFTVICATGVCASGT